MADTANREVTLELGGESYVLAPSFGAVCEVEEKIGGNLFEFGQRLESAQVSAAELIDFARACIAAAGHEVTRERLGELIVEAGAGAVLAPLIEFCRIYVFGPRKEPDPADAEAEKPATPDGKPGVE